MPDIMQVAFDRRAKLQQELTRIESFIRMANALLSASPPAPAAGTGAAAAATPAGPGRAEPCVTAPAPAGPSMRLVGRRRAVAVHEIAPGVVRIAPWRAQPATTEPGADPA